MRPTEFTFFFSAGDAGDDDEKLAYFAQLLLHRIINLIACTVQAASSWKQEEMAL